MGTDRTRELIQREALRHMKIGRFALETGMELRAKEHIETAIALMTALTRGEHEQV